jgi:hypothetical protein
MPLIAILLHNDMDEEAAADHQYLLQDTVRTAAPACRSMA